MAFFIKARVSVLTDLPEHHSPPTANLRDADNRPTGCDRLSGSPPGRLNVSFPVRFFRRISHATRSCLRFIFLVLKAIVQIRNSQAPIHMSWPSCLQSHKKPGIHMAPCCLSRFLGTHRSVSCSPSLPPKLTAELSPARRQNTHWLATDLEAETRA